MKNWILSRLAWMDANIPGNTCTTAINEEGETHPFLIRAYPNPAIGEINIEVQNILAGKLSMEVFNITGQLVYATELGQDLFLTKKISLQPGVYTVRITGGMETETAKIIVH
jgi:hypothetical protein